MTLLGDGAALLATVRRALPIHDEPGATLELYLAIDLSEDPELRAPLLDGELNQYPDGTLAAEVLRVHDPRAQWFFLVVPRALAHRVLQARGEFLLRLDEAQRAGAEVPDYVARAEVVIGVEGLRRRLAEPASGELRLELDGSLRELEASLAARELALDAREEALAALAETLGAEALELDSAEGPVVGELDVEQALVANPARWAGDSFADALAESVELLDADAELLEAEPVDEGKPYEGTETVVQSLDDDDDDEEWPDEGGTSEFARAGDQAWAKEAPVQSVLPPVTPPRAFYDRRSAELVCALIDDALWLFVRRPERWGSAFEEGAELRYRYVEVDDDVAVVFELVDPRGPRQLQRSMVVLPGTEESREILARFERDDYAMVAVFAPGDHYVLSLRVDLSLRRANLRAIREELGRRGAPRFPARVARRALDPAPELAHPFHAREASGARTAADTLEAVAELERWLPRKRELLLKASVTEAAIDLQLERVVEEALRHGLRLAEGLQAEAVARGLAPSRAALTRESIAAFRATAALSTRGGLSQERLQANWRSLALDAKREGVPLTPDLEVLAEP